MTYLTLGVTQRLPEILSPSVFQKWRQQYLKNFLDWDIIKSGQNYMKTSVESFSIFLPILKMFVGILGEISGAITEEKFEVAIL